MPCDQMPISCPAPLTTLRHVPPHSAHLLRPPTDQRQAVIRPPQACHPRGHSNSRGHCLLHPQGQLPTAQDHTARHPGPCTAPHRGTHPACLVPACCAISCVGGVDACLLPQVLCVGRVYMPSQACCLPSRFATSRGQQAIMQTIVCCTCSVLPSTPALMLPVPQSTRMSCCLVLPQPFADLSQSLH